MQNQRTAAAGFMTSTEFETIFLPAHPVAPHLHDGVAMRNKRQERQ